MWWNNTNFDKYLRAAYPWPEQLDYSDLSGLDLSHVNLSKRSLYGTRLHGTTFWGANLDGADFRGADGLDPIMLCGASLKGTLFDTDIASHVPTVINSVHEDGVDKIVASWYDDYGLTGRDPAAGPARVTMRADDREVLLEEWLQEGSPVLGDEYPYRREHNGPGEWKDHYRIPREEGSYGTKVIEYDNGMLKFGRASNHPLGLNSVFRKPSDYDPSGFNIVEEYNALKHKEATGEPVYKIVRSMPGSEKGYKYTYYTGYESMSRADGPVMLVQTDGEPDEKLWGWDGMNYTDEQSWLNAKAKAN
jgi:hypothetical protein